MSTTTGRRKKKVEELESFKLIRQKRIDETKEDITSALNNKDKASFIELLKSPFSSTNLTIDKMIEAIKIGLLTGQEIIDITSNSAFRVTFPTLCRKVFEKGSKTTIVNFITMFKKEIEIDEALIISIIQSGNIEAVEEILDRFPLPFSELKACTYAFGATVNAIELVQLFLRRGVHLDKSTNLSSALYNAVDARNNDLIIFLIQRNMIDVAFNDFELIRHCLYNKTYKVPNYIINHHCLSKGEAYDLINDFIRVFNIMHPTKRTKDGEEIYTDLITFDTLPMSKDKKDNVEIKYSQTYCVALKEYAMAVKNHYFSNDN